MHRLWRLSERVVSRYSLAILAPLVALLVRQVLVATVGELPHYVLFYPAVMLAALLGGLRAGLLATTVAVGLAEYWILVPRGSLAIANLNDAVGLVLFCGMGVFMSAVAEFYRRNRQRAGEYAKELAVSKELALAAAEIRSQKEELRRAKVAAEAANEAKDRFLANVSHELRTPMNVILGMTDLVLDEEIPPTARDYVQTVKESADNLLVLLNEILDFSRIESGEFVLDRAPFRLRPALESLLRTLSVRAYQKGLEVALEVADDVPDRLVGDSRRLRQVFTNLIDNAIKFTEKGEVAVRVEVESQTSEQVCLRCTVSDTGIGVTEEQRQRIFAPFAQADASTTRHYGGTGLGLAIVSSLTGLMGGRIWLERRPCRGSTFCFTVSLGREQGDDRDESSQPLMVQQLRGLSVLVAEDNATTRGILERILVGWGMRPELVADGHAVLARLREAAAADRRFSLTLINASLPSMDGISVVEAIQSNPALRQIATLMVSPADRQTLTKRPPRGAVVYLDKPVFPSRLLAALAEAMVVSVEARPIRSARSLEQLPAARRTLRVLLAEDTPANQKLVSRILGKRGHSMEIANNGREAADLARRKDYDIILMDVSMPVMDGLQATAAIRAIEEPTKAQVPIVAMTAHAMKGDAERCLQAGMDAYIAKPFNAIEMIKTVERLAMRYDGRLGAGCR